jgi:predicted nucleotidyltransferase
VDNYFGLKDELERLFGLPVDLIAVQAIRNPYFREAVESTKRTLYAA